MVPPLGGLAGNLRLIVSTWIRGEVLPQTRSSSVSVSRLLPPPSCSCPSQKAGSDPGPVLEDCLVLGLGLRGRQHEMVGRVLAWELENLGCNLCSDAGFGVILD